MVSDILMLSIAIQGVNNFSGTFRQARAEVSGLQGSLRALGAGIRAAGMSAIMIAAMMTQEFIKSSVAVATEFELSMVRIQAISGATSGEFTKLTDTVKRLGQETMFTRQEVSEGAKEMAMAGLTAGEIAASLTSVVSISEVLGLQMGRTAEVMTDLGLAFQMNIKDASTMAQIADVMYKTATSAALSFEQLGQSMTYVSATANMVGLSLAQTSAALAAMANMGIKGSKAGTSLNRAIQAVIVPSGTARAVMDDLGLSFNAATLSSEGLVGVIKRLEEVGATAADIFTIFGTRAGRSIATLVTTGSTRLAALTEEIENSNNAVKDAQKEIQNTAAYAYKQFQAAIEATKDEMGKWLNKGLVPLSKALIKTGEWIGKNAAAIKLLIGVVTILILRKKILAVQHALEIKNLTATLGLHALKRKVVAKSMAMQIAHTGVLSAANFQQVTANTQQLLHAGYLTKSTAATGTATVAQMAHAGAVMTVSKAYHYLTGAMAANPIGLALIAIVGIVLALKEWHKWTSGQTRQVRNLGEELKGINETLYEEEDIIYDVGISTDLLNAQLQQHINFLEIERDKLDETNNAQALHIVTIDKQIAATETMIDTQYDYEQGLHDVMMKYKGYIKMTDEQIDSFDQLIRVSGFARKQYYALGKSIIDLQDEIVVASGPLNYWTGLIEDNNEIIKLNETRLENLKYEYSDLTKEIKYAEFALEELSDAMSVSDAQIAVYQTGIDVMQNTVNKAEQAFRDSAIFTVQWGRDITEVTTKIDTADASVKKWSKSIKSNNYAYKLLQKEQKGIIASFEGERLAVQAMDNEINRLSDSMNRLAGINNKNNIQMRKIRLKARKAGRDLTQSEIDELERLEIATEENAIKSMEIGMGLSAAQKKKADAEIALETKVQNAIQGTVDAMQGIKDKNAELALDIEDTNLKIMGWEDTKNAYVLESEQGVINYMKDEYGTLLDAIDADTASIGLLEEAALTFASDYADANLILVTKQQDFNLSIADTTLAIWDEIFTLEELNAMEYMPNVNIALDNIKIITDELYKQLDIMKDPAWQAGLATTTKGVEVGTVSDIADRIMDSFGWKGAPGNDKQFKADVRKILDRYIAGGSRSKAYDDLKDMLGDGDKARKWLDQAKSIREYNEQKEDEGFQFGGVAEGPKSGYKVTLHGKERIIPIKSPLSGKIDTGEGTGAGTVINVANLTLIVKELTDLDDPIKIQRLVEAIIKRTTLQARR